MLAAVLALIPAAAALAMPLTWLCRQIGLRAKALDTPPIPGQQKAPPPPRPTPNTGGIALYLSIALPLLAATLTVSLAPGLLTSLVPALSEHLTGLQDQIPNLIIFLVCLTAVHILGLIDDRRPLGPYLKLGIMIGAATSVVWLTDTRLLTALDGMTGSPIPSILITVLWIVIITNAMNFMDNMDGLTAGVAAIAGSCFMAAALAHDRPQWFIAACLALLVGACLGFLVFNFPLRRAGRASIFMGDGGSLVLGFTLAFLTVRTTYVEPTSVVTASTLATSTHWYGVLMPLLVMAVPLYDFASVCLIRLRAGKSPFVGDLNHLSHRLVKRGLTKRDAVLVIYGLTAVTAIGGIALAGLKPWQAMLVGVQTLLALMVLAVYEGRNELPHDDSRLRR